MAQPLIEKPDAWAWPTFIKERFPPLAHSPMIIVFALAHFLSFKTPQAPAQTLQFFLALLFSTLFFFKLRLFDEIKDYQTDLKLNPTRPLPRGILSLTQVKKMIVKIISFEILIIILFHRLNHALSSAFFALTAISYSFLMYKEFFIGKFLRPHLTTYAITHTFVSVLLSLALAMFFSPKTNPGQLILFALSAWAYFNLFEFARKTFATSEERQQVESYSKTFGVSGAYLLSLSQAIVGVLLYLKYIDTAPTMAFVIPVALSHLALMLSGLGMIVLNKNEKAALATKIFRACGGLCILSFYLGIVLSELL